PGNATARRVRARQGPAQCPRARACQLVPQAVDQRGLDVCSLFRGNRGRAISKAIAIGRIRPSQRCLEEWLSCYRRNRRCGTRNRHSTGCQKHVLERVRKCLATQSSHIRNSIQVDCLIFVPYSACYITDLGNQLAGDDLPLQSEVELVRMVRLEMRIQRRSTSSRCESRPGG